MQTNQAREKFVKTQPRRLKLPKPSKLNPPQLPEQRRNSLHISLRQTFVSPHQTGNLSPATEMCVTGRIGQKPTLINPLLSLKFINNKMVRTEIYWGKISGLVRRNIYSIFKALYLDLRGLLKLCFSLPTLLLYHAYKICQGGRTFFKNFYIFGEPRKPIEFLISPPGSPKNWEGHFFLLIFTQAKLVNK